MDNYSILTRVFSRIVIKNLIEKRKDPIFDNAVKTFLSTTNNMTYGESFDALYNIVRLNYRNEYFYKNTLINKLLLGIHSPRTTTALTEIPIARAKGDFILINGKAVVYEIKTELDNFERLENQITNYYKVFDHVSIITCESNREYIQERYKNTPLGIYILSRRGTISELVKPKKQTSYLEPEEMFSVLRKSEFENILKDLYDKLPDVSQFVYYDACKDLFTKIDRSILYEHFVAELKKRGGKKSNNITSVPTSLRFLSYFSDFTDSQYNRLNALLFSNYEGG